MKVIVNFIYEHGLNRLLKNTLLFLEKCDDMDIKIKGKYGVIK